jgi:hypothetical protein
MGVGQATVYGRRDPVVSKAVIEEVVGWKLEEFHDAQTGFANLAEAEKTTTKKVLQKYLDAAPHVPK